jgi:hypothetical protein
MSPDDWFAVILVLTVAWGAVLSRLREPASRRLACLLPSCALIAHFEGGLFAGPLSSVVLYFALRAVPRALAPATGLAVAFGTQLALRLGPAPPGSLGNAFYLVLTLRHGAMGFHLADELAAAGRPRDGAERGGAPASLFEHLCYSLSFYGLFTMPYLTYAQHDAAVRTGHGAADGRAACVALCDAGALACALFLLKAVAPYQGYVDAPHFLNDWPRLAPRLAYLGVSAAQLPLRFLFCWKMTEAAGRLFGLRAALARNADVATVLGAPRLRLKMRAWNESVVRWLGDVVYSRLAWRSRGARALVVFAVSAWWHDVRPPYIAQLAARARGGGGGGGGGGGETLAPPDFKYWITFLQLPFALGASDFMCASVYAPLAAASPRPLAAVVAVVEWACESLCAWYFVSTHVYADQAAVWRYYAAWGWYGHGYLALAAALAACKACWSLATRDAKPARGSRDGGAASEPAAG